MKYWTLAIAGLSVVAAALAGCDSRSGTPEAPPPAAQRSMTRGPVSLNVSLAPGEVKVGDQLTLDVQVVAEDGVDVILPEFGDQLGEFIVRKVERKPTQFDGHSRRWGLACVMSAYAPGKQQVPGVSMQFIDRREAGPEADSPTQEISTEPIDVDVRSVLAGEFDPAEFRDIKPPVELPAPHRLWIWAAAAATVAIAVLALLWLRRRLRRASLEPALTPVAWALEQLTRLEKMASGDAEQVHALYFELSYVVREYIERQFGLQAPERTTEEFLAELRNRPELSKPQKDLLGGFLQAADLVKFARHAPGPDEIRHALRAARRFVEETGYGLASSNARGAAEPAAQRVGQEVGA